MVSMGMARKDRTLDERLAALSDAHGRVIARFRARLAVFVADGLLNIEQAHIVEEHLIRLGERSRNPANTGNLEDLFCHTLTDTGDPIRAYAQALADSVKVVPMDEDADLWPNLRAVDNGKVYRKVRDLEGYNPGDKMLITHTMVAYADPEMRASAVDLIRATRPDLSDAGIEREVARMVVQSQHGPSSTFVLARSRGLTLDLRSLYSEADYSDEQIEAAQHFYDVCARFQPDWVLAFLDGFIPTTDDWADWRRNYLEFRLRLPSELIYQLASDTLTNFLDGTLEAGKWTDASILFGGVTAAEQIPGALAKIVNQYIAEHIALHDRPAQELMDAVAEPLEPWGVGFKRGRAVALPGEIQKSEQIHAQFDAAWARKTGQKPKAS